MKILTTNEITFFFEEYEEKAGMAILAFNAFTLEEGKSPVTDLQTLTAESQTITDLEKIGKLWDKYNSSAFLPFRRESKFFKATFITFRIETEGKA